MAVILGRDCKQKAGAQPRYRSGIAVVSKNTHYYA